MAEESNLSHARNATFTAKRCNMVVVRNFKLYFILCAREVQCIKYAGVALLSIIA